MSREKKVKKMYDKNEVQGYTELIILFIGMSIAALGCGSLFFDIPKEYSIGATIGGLFFVLADTLIIKDKVGFKTLTLYCLSMLFAVISFFLLPVFLLVFPSTQDKFLELTDFSTLVTLGFVVMLLGYRAVDSRSKAHTEIANEITETQKELNTFATGMQNELKNLTDAWRKVEEENEYLKKELDKFKKKL